jgi:hypothetical protein
MGPKFSLFPSASEDHMFALSLGLSVASGAHVDYLHNTELQNVVVLKNSQLGTMIS